MILKRGEIWTSAGGAADVGKPRPVLIVQADDFSETASVTMCPITSHDVGTRHSRVAINSSEANGLREPSFAMADKITTVPRERLGKKLGELSPAAMVAVERAMVVFLGLAG